MRTIELRRHTMRVKPGQHLSQAGVTLARNIGSTIGPFDHVVASTIPRALETAIAMGYAVDEEDEQFGCLPQAIENEVGTWDAGFAAFGRATRSSTSTRFHAERLAARLADIAMLLPDDGAALVISHGGIVELAAVGCLPEADHAAWGPWCDYCEGVRLRHSGEEFVEALILRLDAR